MNRITSIAILLLNTACYGCFTTPAHSIPTPSADQAATWHPLEKRQETFFLSCVGRGVCTFAVEGFWRSASGRPGSELADPTFVKLSCEQGTNTCMEFSASVDSVGRLDSDVNEYAIKSWTAKEIIATSVRGLCDIEYQFDINIQTKSVIMRSYPTKSPDNQLCKPFSDSNSFILHGGTWQLWPPAVKKFDERK
jgi:hypothetical protein